MQYLLPAGDLATDRSEDSTAHLAPAGLMELEPRVDAQKQAPAATGIGSQADAGTQTKPVKQEDGSRRHKKDRRKRKEQRGKDRKEKGRSRHQRKPDATTKANPLDPDLPPAHPCANFSLPPPPSDPKRTGPRGERLVSLLGTPRRRLLFSSTWIAGTLSRSAASLVLGQLSPWLQ